LCILVAQIYKKITDSFICVYKKTVIYYLNNYTSSEILQTTKLYITDETVSILFNHLPFRINFVHLKFYLTAGASE